MTRGFITTACRELIKLSPLPPKPPRFRKPGSKPPARFRPDPEMLEGRRLLSTFKVGNDPSVCPRADFASIQAAVNAAKPGDTIEVYPGTYTEQVVILNGKDNLDIKSKGPLKAVIQAPQSLADQRAIVRIVGAQGVTIEGFIITGPSQRIAAGVQVDSGASAVIRGNDITEIHDLPLSGNQTGIGISVLDATATIASNRIKNYQKVGILVESPNFDGSSGTADATVTHNAVLGVGPTDVNGQNGIQISSGATARIDHNIISGNIYSPQTYVAAGIILVNPGPVRVDHNTVATNDVGIVLQDAVNSVIDHNTIFRSTFDGIELRGSTTGAVIAHNDASQNTFGDIYIEPTVTGNTIIDNRRGHCLRQVHRCLRQVHHSGMALCPATRGAASHPDSPGDTTSGHCPTRPARSRFAISRTSP